MSSNTRISYKVDGKVQGVCFRDHTQTIAKRIGVTGYVTNASDGTVKGEAQGSSDAIKQFLEHINEGPSAARVTGVEHSEISTKSGESSFDVK
ncbi:Acylphosphatase [Setomelanomma holmii]|uniref:acylphosphatase n=1 Tax=Setomelanomma holmii TaxID=210430 RepID=A0A9P4H068_9PLEO|nr:Acylphosphatase [Setomelanomma holmii]